MIVSPSLAILLLFSSSKIPSYSLSSFGDPWWSKKATRMSVNMQEINSKLWIMGRIMEGAIYFLPALYSLKFWVLQKLHHLPSRFTAQCFEYHYSFFLLVQVFFFLKRKSVLWALIKLIAVNKPWAQLLFYFFNSFFNPDSDFIIFFSYIHVLK